MFGKAVIATNLGEVVVAIELVMALARCRHGHIAPSGEDRGNGEQTRIGKLRELQEKNTEHLFPLMPLVC